MCTRDAPLSSIDVRLGAVTSAFSVALLTEVPRFSPIWSVSPDTPASTWFATLSSTWRMRAGWSPMETVTSKALPTSSMEKVDTDTGLVMTLPEPLILEQRGTTIATADRAAARNHLLWSFVTPPSSPPPRPRPSTGP